MAVQAEAKGVKIVLKLKKGSQTISNCSKLATDEALFEIGKAVSELEKEEMEGMAKVVETTLIEA